MIGLSDTQGCPVNFLRMREHHASKNCWGSSSGLTSFLSRRLDIADNLYRRDLYAHFGCVNAIEFSQEGCWLISGGDDRRVLLWNLEASISGNCKPIRMKEEHGSNIFCLAFDSLNSKIFSAGNDEQVIVHDVKTREAVNVFMHEEAIYSVSVNPYVDSVFASAGEDGQILIFDIRAPASVEPLLLARSYDAYHSVQFHPLEPMFIVTANSKEGVVLWDVRKPRTPFVKYGEKRSSESSMCAKFNSNGTQIVALRRRMHPILFNTGSPSPVCEFDADLYYNSCTMKSCCFAGARDQFILSGSDDFSLYMWRIPDPSSNISFMPEAHMVLKGHRSIVNQVRFNVNNFTIASSGVEKIVKLWSPVAVPGSRGSIHGGSTDSYMTRKVYTHEDYIGLVLDSGQTVVSHDYSNGSTDEDPKMMAFFDSLVQREVEGWTTNSDLSDDDLDTNSNSPRHSSSSPATSQSDSGESDSDSDVWRHTFSPMRRRRARLQMHRQMNGTTTGTSNTGRRKPVQPQGSDWILKLIAKKRAQLKAAKKKKRNLKKKQKSKARQFIRCFTSSRQYLYRPENNRATTSNRSNRAAPADLLRRRHVVAPYTMLSLGHIEESDGDNSDEEEPPPRPPPLSAVGPSLFTPQVVISSSSQIISSTPSGGNNLDGKRNSCELRFWSSGSSSSADEGKAEGGNVSKKRRSDGYASSSRNSEVHRGANSLSLLKSDISSNSKFTLRTYPSNASSDTVIESGSSSNEVIDNDRFRDSTVNDTDNRDNTINELNTEASDNSTEKIVNESTVVPIRGVSTDEAGSLMFVTNQYDKDNNIDHNSHDNDSNTNNNSLNNINNGSSNNNDSNYISNDNDRSYKDINFSSVFNHLKRNYKSGTSSTRDPSQPNEDHAFPHKKIILDTNKLSFCEEGDTDPQYPASPGESPEESESPSPSDAGTSTPYGATASTPDSGISVGDKGVEDSSSEQDRKDSRFTFRKKKIPEFRMKSYRSRIGDDLDDVKE